MQEYSLDGVAAITKAFNAFTNSIKEGFENLYDANDKFKKSVDSLKASAITLKKGEMIPLSVETICEVSSTVISSQLIEGNLSDTL